MIRFTAYWLVMIVWIAAAVPILSWSVMVLELPLWPEFGPDSTAEGIAVWAVYTAFFYVTPILLFLNKRAGRLPSKKMIADAQD